MGECLLVRRGGSVYKLPVLNASYPQDVTVVASANGSAVFSVQITEPGNPAEYTYKWYKGGNLVSGTTGATLNLTGLTAATTTTVYCEVTNKAGTVTSRVATLTVRDWKPVYSYTGNAQFVNDGNYNWRVKFLTSGTLRFTSLGNASTIDVFCVGGGSAGTHAQNDAGGSGGAGGYTKTSSGVSVALNTAIPVVVGAGGVNPSNNTGAGGGTTQFGPFVSAAGGAGTNGGSGGGMNGYYDTKNDMLKGGTDGGNAAFTASGSRGIGQGTTTREFGESSGTLYSGGGSGANRGGDMTAIAGGAGGGGTGGTGTAGGTNTGGGGGGYAGEGGGGGTGGSGIVVIRNHR